MKGEDAMSWKKEVKRGFTCPMCKAPNSFAIKQGTYSTLKQKRGRALYECSECNYRDVIG